MHDVFVIGGLVLDLAEKFNKYPEEGEEVFSSSFSSVIGGTAYNVAQSLLFNGISPLVSAYIGDDLIGELIEDALESKGINTHLIKTKEKGTGIVFSVLTPDDRTMFTYRGADEEFAFTEEMVEIARSSKITYISSYVLMGKATLNDVIEFIDKIRPYTKIFFSVAKGVLDTRIEWVSELLSHIDIMCMNEEEYGILRSHIYKVDIPIVVTLGPKGAKYVESGYIVDSPQKENVKGGRFTGAGDAFCGGFISAMLKGFSLEKALSLGNSTSLSWILYKFG